MNLVTVGLVIVMSFVGVSQAQGPSENLLNLLSMLSGNFTNDRQAANEKANKNAKERHDFITNLWLPVYVPSLSPALTFYHEEVDNGFVYRGEMWVFTEVGNEIHIQPLNVSNFDSSKPGELQNSDWSKVSLEPADELCKGVFRPVDVNIYMGTMPYCTRKMHNDQQLPYYSFTVTCNAVNIFVHFEASRETVGRVPYVFRIKTRFPLPNEWTDQVNGYSPPCGYN